jgi:hypothetical protein
MSAKILNKAKSYQPVTIELTFDTLEQLKCFHKIYANPYETAKNLFNGGKFGVIDEATDSIDATIDTDTIVYLAGIIGRYY